jgi:hypothetical protein
MFESMTVTVGLDVHAGSVSWTDFDGDRFRWFPLFS